MRVSLAVALIGAWGCGGGATHSDASGRGGVSGAGQGGSDAGKGGMAGPAGRGGGSGASGDSGATGGGRAGQGGSAGSAETGVAGTGAAGMGAAGTGAAGTGAAGTGAAGTGAAGTGGGAPISGCPSPFAGDPALPPALEVVTVGTFNAPAAPLEDGGSLTILPPPQGGSIVLVGARARNLNPCGVMLTVGLRDTNTQQVRLDGRTVNLQTSTAAPDWVETSSQLAGMANVPVCPNQWASTDIFGHIFQLEVTVEDSAHRRAMKTLQVTPACSTDKNYPMTCACQCVAGYTLGQACPPTR
jgi:hypothetical protein